MYDFHYNYMKVKYPRADQLKLLFTDTDSLTYHIETEDIYADMLKDNHLSDFVITIHALITYHQAL